MYVYTYLGLWLDWLLLLGSFTSRLHSFPLPPSPSLYTLDQYFTYIRVSKEKKIIFSWSCGRGVLFDLLLRHLLHLLVMVVVVAVVVVVVVRATLYTSHPPSIHNRVVSSNSSSSSIT